MQQRNLKALISKIILFYSVFYVIMKVIAILFQDAWPIPHLILSIPFLVFAIVGWITMKKEQYSWVYVASGIVIISIVRYFEAEWAVALQNYFN